MYPDDVEVLERLGGFDSPDATFQSMSMTALASRIDNVLHINSEQDELFLHVPKMSGRSSLMALDHFARSTHSGVGPPTSGKLMRGGVVKLALSVCPLYTSSGSVSVALKANYR